MSTPLRTARRVVVGVVGATVLGLGVAMLVLPGPALLVIPVGLAILATEFVWARTRLRRIRELAGRGRGLERPAQSPPMARTAEREQ